MQTDWHPPGPEGWEDAKVMDSSLGFVEPIRPRVGLLGTRKAQSVK
jgi:hypothetical protein